RIGIGNLEALGKTALADKALAVREAGIDLLVASKIADAELVAIADDPDPLVALQAAIAVMRAHPELGGKALDRAIAGGDWTTRSGAANFAVQAVGKAPAI